MDYTDYKKQAGEMSNAGKYAEAVEFYTLAIDHYPKKGEQGYDKDELAKLYYERGRLYEYLDNYYKALVDYDKAIEIIPSSWIYRKRAQIYFDLKKYLKSLENYNMAIELKPDDATIYHARGGVYLRLKNYTNALMDYNHAINTSLFEHGFYYLGRGNIYFELKDYEKSLLDYNRAIIDLNCNSSWLYNGRGNVYFELKDYTKSSADYHKMFNLIKKRSNLEKYYKKRQYHKIHIFKFSSINDNTFKTLINEELFLAQPHKDWNDTYDCNIGRWTKLAKEIFHKHARLQSFVFKETQEENPFENMLMWAHYADSHKGICVEYTYDLNNKNKISFHKVKYQDEIQFDELNDAFLIKSKVWAYENEARLFYFDEKTNETDKVIKTFKDLGLSIKAVYFGSKCSADNQKAIQKILQDRGIDFYEMRTDAGSFVLGAEKIIQKQKEALEIEHL